MLNVVRSIREYVRILTEDTVTPEQEDRLLMSIDVCAEVLEDELKKKEVIVKEAHALLVEDANQILIEESGSYNVFDTPEQAEEALEENKEIGIHKNFRIAECQIVLN